MPDDGDDKGPHNETVPYNFGIIDVLEKKETLQKGGKVTLTTMIAGEKTIVFEKINDVYSFIKDGRFQLLTVMVCCLATFPMGLQSLILYFLAFDPGWKCVPDSLVCTHNGTIRNSDTLYRARCNMNRTDWMYVTSDKFSIVTEFDLCCDNEHWIETSLTLYYLGNLIGAFLLGWMSDRYGRSKVIFVSVTSVLSFTLASAFLKQFWLFEMLRFLSGVMQSGTIIVIITLCSEITGPTFRAAAGQCPWFFNSLGIASSGVMAYYLQEWRKIMIYSAAPWFFLLILLWFVPETFIWLHNANKDDQLEKVIKKIAKINNVKDSQNILLECKACKGCDDESEETSVFSQIASLFQSRGVLLITLCTCFEGFTCGLVYFGISLVADNLTGDAYRDFVILVLLDIPATMVAITSSSRIGRKFTTILSMFIGSLCIFIIGFVPASSSKSSARSISRLSLGICGKFMITTGYVVMTFWCVELYPTKSRSTASGLFNAAASIGSISSPWVGMWLRHLKECLPFFIMGGCGVVASLLLIGLPETKGKHLPQQFSSPTSSNGIDPSSDKTPTNTPKWIVSETPYGTVNETYAVTEDLTV